MRHPLRPAVACTQLTALSEFQIKLPSACDERTKGERGGKDIVAGMQHTLTATAEVVSLTLHTSFQEMGEEKECKSF